MYPLSSNFAKYPCTVAVELKPTAFPISLTDGGYPTDIICLSIYLNIDFSLEFNSGFFLGIYITPFHFCLSYHTNKKMSNIFLTFF